MTQLNPLLNDDGPMVTLERPSMFGLNGPAVASPPTVAGASTEEVVAALHGGASTETLALIDQLRTPQKRSLVSQLGVLAVSLLLFLGAGLLDWSVRELALLVVVLLIHESGHLLAMKVLGYSDVRMFFIPFFGAAASGTARRASGARRTLVALAGPVPGILLGVVLAFVYALTLAPWAGAASKMLLLLNVFNLLPLLPLDGGHVLLETLFVRNRWLEAAFQVAAGAGLAALAITARAPILGILAFMTLMAAPRVLKIAKLASEVRATADAPLPTSIPETPLPLMIRVVEAEELAFGAARNTNVREATIRTVFERLHPNPPRAWAAIGMLAVYGAAFVAAFIGWVFIIIAQSPR